MSPHRVRIVGPWKKPPICDRQSNTNISVIDHFFYSRMAEFKDGAKVFFTIDVLVLLSKCNLKVIYQ